MKVLITGSGGLIGSEAGKFFLEKNDEVFGIDNNMRKYFFGNQGDVTGNIELLKTYKNYKHFELDLRNRSEIEDFFKQQEGFDLIIHAAAQPSHDWASKEPYTDFDVNALATINLLESFRRYSSKGVFIFTSTNKVYGDNPNNLNLVENDKRFDYSKNQTIQGVTVEGINENMSIDKCKHSLFGASKTSADIFAQEYGKYFGLDIGVFRGGCLTGPQHTAVELHGFLAYIVNCAKNRKKYTIFGYKGKQVRDQIHSYDVVSAFYDFYKNPKKGEVYNIGGTKKNSASILEIIDLLDNEFDLKLDYSYKDTNRIGDHICYYTDMTKFKKNYPNWEINKQLKDIISEML